ncbi:response regulator transcription factor [Cellulomonas sp. NPDC089187]|uniref:response regulator transcription factor n=1 Tax=Cellulomonas sp. NPDC089187 TaxID=3154970 RepID=UPI00341F4A07
MRVLVVEDEERLAAGLRTGLEAEGFAVDVADNGTDGLWLAQENQYDAVLLDLMLPGLDGYQVCRRLREAGCWVPVVMLTAMGEIEDQVEGLESGADDYVTKPFAFPVLVARLRALIRRGAPERPVVLTAGDLSFDPASRRAMRGDVDLRLTAREAAVLEHLIRRPDTVHTKRDIVAGVWDDDFDGDPNIVEVYIRRLRAKVDEPMGRNAIRTVRGAGYVLDGRGG